MRTKIFFAKERSDILHMTILNSKYIFLVVLWLIVNCANGQLSNSGNHVTCLGHLNNVRNTGMQRVLEIMLETNFLSDF